ncbi:hypothetical protein BL253_05355 [Pseudofrankia asymbiotica]|uniref:Cytochrome n=1 Tax=Pseudofrankia asymbiotica TaxID=1834516 RepID=A0A1V2IJ05_9ACTN|nr:hypothetical protein [Pseudofrankia asymbiotica]ONH32456.1 hypothetical protein BL253_05355 [Pseudofrankia asymbiotica]
MLHKVSSPRTAHNDRRPIRPPSPSRRPYTFDIGRSPNPQLGFGGGGPHFCLGRHLAMLEIELMYRTLAARVRRVEPLGPPSRLRSNLVNGVTAMPVRLLPT